MSFLNSFVETGSIFPDKVALEFIDPPLQRLTYAELNEFVNRTSGNLQSHRVNFGDCVALQFTKSIEFILLHFALLNLTGIIRKLTQNRPILQVQFEFCLHN